MDFALHFKPGNTVSTFHTMKLVIVDFFLILADRSICPVPNPCFYFAIPGLKDLVFI